MERGIRKKQIQKRKWMLLSCMIMALIGCQKIEDSQNVGSSLSTEQLEVKEDTTESVTFIDDLGREVTVCNPKRVVALLGSFADIWYLAGGTIHASADDAWEDFDLPLSSDAVNLGMTKELSLEKLLESDPDFILASSNTKINVAWKETLEKIGIPTAYFNVSDVQDYIRMLKICTQITGREDLYKENGIDVLEQIELVIADSQKRLETSGKTPVVLSLRASASYIRAKNSTGNVLGEMLKTLGCKNLADDDDSLLENLNIEYIMECDPDYIFICQIGDEKEAVEQQIKQFFEENPVWSQLTAVKEGRVYMLEKELYTLKPNDKWGEAYEKLESILSAKSI